MVHRERTRQGLVRGKSLGNLYSERYEYLDKAYDLYTALFNNAMTDDTKSRLNRENTRGFETDLESGFSEESQGFSME